MYYDLILYYELKNFKIVYKNNIIFKNEFIKIFFYINIILLLFDFIYEKLEKIF